MGFINTGSVVTTAIYNLLYLWGAMFLIYYTSQEHLRMGWIKVSIVGFIMGILYIPLGYITPFAPLIYIACSFIYCRWLTRLPMGKLYIIIIFVTNILYLASISIQTFSNFHALMLPLLPLYIWTMRKKMWPLLREIGAAEVRILVPLTTILVFISMFFNSPFILRAIQPGWQYTFVVFLLSAATFTAYYLMLVMMQTAIESTKATQRLQFVDVQLADQSQRYKEITKHSDEIRILRHDLRHHALALSGMLGEKKYDEAKDYVSKYVVQADTIEQPICRCYAVDVIVRRYKTEAEKKGISTDVCIALPKNCGIDDIDLCIILGNLMENAINAAAKIKEEKRLRVAVKVEGSEVLIAVDNTCLPEEIALSDGSGLGIPSVQAIAKKYGGMARFERKDEIFMASVLLYKSCEPINKGRKSR